MSRVFYGQKRGASLTYCMHHYIVCFKQHTTDTMRTPCIYAKYAHNIYNRCFHIYIYVCVTKINGNLYVILLTNTKRAEKLHMVLS